MVWVCVVNELDSTEIRVQTFFFFNIERKIVSTPAHPWSTQQATTQSKSKLDFSAFGTQPTARFFLTR